jgi:hypothetical protein
MATEDHHVGARQHCGRQRTPLRLVAARQLAERRQTCVAALGVAAEPAETPRPALDEMGPRTEEREVGDRQDPSHAAIGQPEDAAQRHAGGGLEMHP